MKPRNQHFLQGRAWIAAAAVLFLSACNKDDDGIQNNNTITDLLVKTDDFNTLEAAVTKAGLAPTLSGTGPFTVFAPDNAAFAASGITPAVLNSLTADQVKTILLYHTLPDKVVSTAVPAGPNAKVTTASGDSVFVTRNASGVYVNGIKVTQADIDATNGVVHKIGRVLILPVGNVVQTAQAPGSGLDSLVKALVRANNGPGGDPNLLATLGSATVTVFAPTNAAFTQLLAALGTNDINNIPVATLLAVLRYHVTAGRAFSSDLQNGSLTMLASGNTTINLTAGTGGGPTVTGNGNSGNKSNIVATNVVARNGVVHSIDRVLLP